MFSTISLSVSQALQMVALAPCVLVIFYLIFRSQDKKTIIMPVLYFLAILCSILDMLLPAFLNYNALPNLQQFLMAGASLISAFSFLLILQFMLNRTPPLIYFVSIFIPLISSVPLIYGAINNDFLCLGIDTCFASEKILHLNNIIISLFIFMLLVFVMVRRAKTITGDEQLKKYKYWLIISLISYNLLKITVELLFVAGKIYMQNYVFVSTMINIAFVYMVMTSIFRVFTDTFDMKPLRPISLNSELTLYEKSIADKIDILLREKHVYREINLNRAALAKMLLINEHQLSKIINVTFKKKFNDLINEYRINSARKMLQETNIPITQISFDAGFNSIPSFNRVFKRIVGKSPSEYRADINTI